jgi:hypothetical protein
MATYGWSKTGDYKGQNGTISWKMTRWSKDTRIFVISLYDDPNESRIYVRFEDDRRNPYAVVQKESMKNQPFTESEAIAEVLKKRPEFPDKSGQTRTVEVPIGGPLGNRTNVNFKTEVQQVDEETYIVTLSKDWHLKINGKAIVSHWKYRVTKNDFRLYEFEDMDDAARLMK